MPRTNTDYATLAEAKSFLRITGTQDDAELGFAVTAASRAVDLATNRAFGVDDPAVARIYSYERSRLPLEASMFRGRRVLQVDDISSTVGLVVKLDEDDTGTFEKTLTIDVDYRLWPYNAATDGRPFDRIVLDNGASFPTHLRGIEVTAKFGWASVPVAIKDATLVQAARFYTRRNAPFGVAGSPETGSEMRLLRFLDPDVQVLVQPYRRHWAVMS